MNTALLGLAVVLTFGCNENLKQEDPEPLVTPTCRLMKIPNGGPGPGLIYSYSPDSLGGRLIRREGAFSEMNITYDSLGRIRDISSDSDTRHYGYILTTFEYNEKSQVIREKALSISEYSTALYELVTDLTYDLQGRLTSRLTYEQANPGVITRKTNYAYTANGGLFTEFYELNLSKTALEMNFTTEETFDTYKTPGYGYQYFDRNYPIRHNPVYRKTTWYTNGAVSKTEIQNLSYTYNAGGYPVQNSAGIIYTYACK